YLPPAGEDFRAALVELVHIDLEFRLKGGEPACVESYLKLYPELAEEPAAVAGLIVAEFRLRRRHTPGVSAPEYLRRFPGYGPELSARLDAVVDEAVPAGP